MGVLLVGTKTVDEGNHLHDCHRRSPVRLGDKKTELVSSGRIKSPANSITLSDPRIMKTDTETEIAFSWLA